MERNLTHIALFAALIAVLGLIPKIDLISGVPVTAQSLGIMLCGTVLGAKRGFLAVVRDQTGRQIAQARSGIVGEAVRATHASFAEVRPQ